jgi:hypothetical protein
MRWRVECLLAMRSNCRYAEQRLGLRRQFGPVSAKRPGTNGHYYQVFTAAVVDDNFTILWPNLSHD